MTSKVEKNEGVTNHLMIAFIIGLILLFLANLGFAQERAVDAASTTAAVNTVKEVPSVSKQLAGKWLKEAVKKADEKKSEAKKKVVLGEMWLPLDVTGASDPDDASEQVIADNPTSTAPSGDCDPSNSGQICSVLLDLSTGNQTTLQNLLNQVEDDIAEHGETDMTVEDFISAGASYTGSLPEYAFKNP